MNVLYLKTSETKQLEEALAKLSSELVIAKKNCQISQRKLEFPQKATENRLVDNITNPDGYISDNILIGVYSATLNEDQFEFDENSETETRSRKDLFLSMKSKLNLESERFKEVSNLILEKVKLTQRIRNRSGSKSCKKRRFKVNSEKGSPSTRPRTSSIPIKQ